MSDEIDARDMKKAVADLKTAIFGIYDGGPRTANIERALYVAVLCLLQRQVDRDV